MSLYKAGLSVFLLLICSYVHAQRNFVEGYVVDNSGDTIRGLIDDKNWRINPESINFKKSGEEGITTYTPGDIKAFRTVTGEYFKSKTVSYDESPVEISKIGKSPNPQWKKDTLFLKVEAEGKVNLYFFLEKKEKEHFFIEKDELGAEDLLNVQYFAYHEEVRKLVTTQQYKSQLRNYLSDCNVSREQLSDIRYSLEPIKNIIVQYNQCKGQISTVSRENHGKKIEIGLVAGAHFTTLKFRSALSGRHSELTTGEYKNNLDGAAGVSVDIFIPRAHRQLVLHNEVLYKQYHVSNTNERQASLGSPYVKEESYFKMSYLQANVMFRYHLATFTKVRPFIQAGGFVAKNIEANSLLRTQTIYQTGGTYYNEKPALDDLKGTPFGLVGGIGATAGRYGLEVRYERGNGPTEHEFIGSFTQSVYFLASYTLR